MYELGRLAFPECKKLPQLAKCFQDLEKFIFTPQTWIQCECDQDIIGEVQESVNLCVVLIHIEKKYAQQFWHLKRRVQASICHFFALFLFLISSLIPGDKFQTINETRKAGKLCTSLKSLEVLFSFQSKDLVNKILPEINPIIKFLYQQGFLQEKNLTILFLQQIKQVLLNLPYVNKQILGHQFQLTKYLYLIIPIELSKNQYKFKTRRRKAATISNEIEMRYHSDEFVSSQSKNSWYDESSDQKRKFSLSKLNESKQKEIYRTKVVKEKVVRQTDEANNLNFSQTHPFLPKLFQFSQRVRKNSFYVSQKKVTKATLKTRQTMEIKFQAQKSRKRTKKSDSQSKQKQYNRTFSIQKQKQKTNETIRSKKSSFYKIHKKTENQQSQILRPYKETKIVKLTLKKQFNQQEIILKPYLENPHEKPSKKLNIFEGKSKGWGIIQDDFNKKRLLKEIQKLIHSKQLF